MFSNQYFADSDPKKNSRAYTRAHISATTDITRAHVREDFFCASSVPVPGRVISTPVYETCESGIPQNEIPRSPEPRLPPARHCLAPDCPCPIAIWITVYDRDSPEPEFRCWGCSPPPSWSFVGARWLLAFPGDRWTWEPFPRFNPRSDPHHDPHGRDSHANPNSLAAIGGDRGGGDAGDVGRPGDGGSWYDREPSSITAADGSRITILEPTGWNDLLRLTVRHGFEEAWRLLQVRTDLKLPRAG